MTIRNRKTMISTAMPSIQGSHQHAAKRVVNRPPSNETRSRRRVEHVQDAAPLTREDLTGVDMAKMKNNDLRGEIARLRGQIQLLQGIVADAVGYIEFARQNGGSPAALQSAVAKLQQVLP